MKGCFVSLTAVAAIAVAALPARAQTTAATPAHPPAAAVEPTSPPTAAIVLRALQRMFAAEPAHPDTSPMWREMPGPQLKPGPTCGLIVTPPMPRLEPRLENVSMARPRHLGMRSVPVFCR